MTREEKIKVLAALDGWERRNEPEGSANPYAWWKNNDRYVSCGEIFPSYIPSYLTSYDAIIPLIQKQPKEIRLKMFEEKADRVSIMTTPEQLADALIKAVGKWRDQMQITAKQIRELANKKQEEAIGCKYGSSEYLRLLRISFEGQRITQSLDDLKELFGVSHLSVVINDRP